MRQDEKWDPSRCSAIDWSSNNEKGSFRQRGKERQQQAIYHKEEKKEEDDGRLNDRIRHWVSWSERRTFLPLLLPSDNYIA
jgi:hypothetical protein